MLSNHLLSVVNLDPARLSRHQTTNIVNLDKSGNLIKEGAQRDEDEDDEEEFCTPGQDMADVVQ